MSFIKVPTELRTPTIPGMTIGEVWAGRGTDQGYLVSRISDCPIRGYVMTANSLGYHLKCGSEILYPYFSNVNYYSYWHNSLYVYRDYRWGWVVSHENLGVELVETTETTGSGDDQKTTYSGSRFYTGDLPEVKDGASSTFQPRGALRDSGSSVTLSFWMPRYTSSTLTGIYTPSAGSGYTGTRKVGLPCFTDNLGRTYVRSLEKKGSYYTYGNISYQSPRWVLGKYNSDEGWYEGSEPKTDKSVTFTFHPGKNQEETRDPLTVTFKEYVLGSETQKIFMGEAAIWR